MRSLPTSFIAVSVCLVFGAASSAAQGPVPLDDSSYARAISEGKNGKPEMNYPFLMRLRSGSHEAIEQIEKSPFSFYIQTPYTRVAGRVAFDTMKFRDPDPPTKDEANAGLVSIEVSPGRSFCVGRCHRDSGAAPW